MADTQIPDIQISDLPGRTTPAGTDLMHVEASGADYKAELSALVNAVTDAAPTEDSPAPVSSGGVHTALAGKQDALTFDDIPTEDSDNPVKSGGVFDALAGKQDVLTFDNTPTENSNNPVKSGGVFDAIAATDAKVLYDSYIVPTRSYSVGGSSIDLTSISEQYNKPGYARFTLPYAVDQNYLICSVSPLANNYYLNVYNGHSGALSSRVVLYFIYIRTTQA